MTREEAEHHTAQARYHAGKLRDHIAAIYEREGFKALDYPTFEAWAEQELAQGYKWALKLRNAVVVQRELEQALSPQGETVPDLPTKHAEQLHKLPSPEAKARAYQRASALAEAEGSSTIATRHVKQAVEVEQDTDSVRQAAYPVVWHMMDAGDITAKQGKAIVAALDRCAPDQQRFVLALIGQYGLGQADLVPRLAALVHRPDSKLLPEVRSGYLGGVPLARATLTDWNTAAEEARREHLAEKDAERNATATIQAQIVTVYRTSSNDCDVMAAAQRTLAALRQVLRDEDLQALRELL